jgi:hypothetical protein
MIKVQDLVKKGKMVVVKDCGVKTDDDDDDDDENTAW